MIEKIILETNSVKGAELLNVYYGIHSLEYRMSWNLSMPSVESFKRGRGTSVLNVVSIATWPVALSVGKSLVINDFGVLMY